MIYPPNQKPPIWSIDPGIIAYNCQKAGMPHPVLAMPMWEGAGNRAIDLSGHGNHGDLQSTTSWSSCGLIFNGTTDYVEKINPNRLPTSGTDDWTVSFWVKPKTLTNGDVLIAFSDMASGASGSQRAIIRFSDAIYFWGEASDKDFGVDLTLNVWQHIVIVHNDISNTMVLYKDNNITSVTAPALTNIAAKITIGQKVKTWQSWLDGIMNNVSIYNVALSAAQVKFLYDNPYFMYQIPEELYGYVAAGGTIRELSTTIASTTTLSSASTNVLREITTSIDATTATTAKLRILREMSSAIASTTATSAISANILREIQAAIAVSTTTATSNLLLLREISSTIAATTSTSTPAFNVLRELTSTIAATTSLSQIELLVGVLRELSTTVVASTSTSASEVNILRELTSALAAQTTSIATLDILREITVTVVAGTSLSQIELLLGTLRELTTTVAATTTTSTPAFNVLREFTSTVGATTASSAKVDILRELVSTIAAQTTLSQIELLVGALIELSTTIAASTSTSAANLNVVRAFATTVSATTSTSDITILMVRALSAQIAAGTDVGAATVLVLREFSTSVDATTLTSSIELLLEAVQIIINTQIHPFTPEQMATSFTPKRLISST